MESKKRYKGIICIIMSAFCFALMSFFVRMAGDLPPIQKSFFRNFVAAIFAGVILMKNGVPFHCKKENLGYMLGRSICGTIGILCNFYAVDHLVLADASMLNKMSPFFAVIFSYFLLKEKITVPQGLFVIGAFVGSLFDQTDIQQYGSAPFPDRTVWRNRCRSGIYDGKKTWRAGRKGTVYCIFLLYLFLCCDVAMAAF